MAEIFNFSGLIVSSRLHHNQTIRMKSKRLLITAGVILGGLIIAWIVFGGSKKHLKLIPFDAKVVVTLDVKSLHKKMDTDKIKEMSWFKENFDNDEGRNSDGLPKVLATILKEKRGSGVDVFSNMYGYSHNVNGQDYVAFVFAISDQDDFEKTISQSGKDIGVISKDSYKMARVSGSTMAWNSFGGIIFNEPSRYDFNEDDSNSDSWTVQFLDWTFGREKDTSILNSDSFDDYGDAKNDLSFFVNGTALYEEAMKNSGGVDADVMRNMKFFQDTYILTDVDFKDNSIEINTHIESDNSEYDKIQFLKNEGLSAEHLKLITDKDIYALWSMNLDIESLYDYYKVLPGFSDARNEILSELSITEEQLKKAFGGELSAALIGFRTITRDPFANMSPEDIEMYKQFDMYEQLLEQAKPHVVPVFTVNCSFSDKELMHKIISKSDGLISIGEDGLYTLPGYLGFDVYLAETSIGCMLSNSRDIALKAKSGALGELPSFVEDLPSKNGMSFYTNTQFKQYPEDIQTEITEMSSSMMPLFSYLALFENVEITANEDKSLMKINLTEGEGNSLYRMFYQGEMVFVSEKSMN